MISWLGTWYKHFIILCAWWYFIYYWRCFQKLVKMLPCNCFCMKLFFCFPSPLKLINNDVRKQIVENKIWSNLQKYVISSLLLHCDLLCFYQAEVRAMDLIQCVSLNEMNTCSTKYAMAHLPFFPHKTLVKLFPVDGSAIFKEYVFLWNEMTSWIFSHLLHTSKSNIL